MRLLFVENTLKTCFWERVARVLRGRGREIHWLVQNPLYAPSGPGVHVLPWRKPAPRGSGDALRHVRVERVRASDRNLALYGGDDAHYGAYAAHIARVLDEVRPRAVFGETTLFHELITSELCRARGIPYLQPSSVRYPRGRFAFFLHDTMDILGGPGDMPSASSVDLEIAQIREHRAIPDYMQSRPFVKTLRGLRWRAEGLLRNAVAYGVGARHNIPSPWRRVGIFLERRRARGAWDRVAESKKAREDLPSVLYPLQLQPEANIDIWGQAWRDQEALIRGLSETLRGKANVLVKANPKWRSEVSDGLLAAVRELENVVPVPRRIPMSRCLETVALVVTVTGTIAMECVIRGKPIVVLAKEYLSDVPGIERVDALAELPRIMDPANCGGGAKASNVDCREMLARLWSRSYPGVISDPSSAPDCMKDSNVAMVTGAFEHVLQFVKEIRA